jgi:predicted DNA-binding protein (UPF0251 family)
LNKEDGYKVYIEIPQLKELVFNKSQIARKLEISRPTFHEYYDLSLEEIEGVLQSMNTIAKKTDEYHDKILNWI